MNGVVIALMIANMGLMLWTYKTNKAEKSKIDELVLVELAKISRDNGVIHGELENIEGKIINYGCMTLDKMDQGNMLVVKLEEKLKKEVKATIIEQLIIPPSDKRYILVPVTAEGKICR